MASNEGKKELFQEKSWAGQRRQERQRERQIVFEGAIEIYSTVFSSVLDWVFVRSMYTKAMQNISSQVDFESSLSLRVKLDIQKWFWVEFELKLESL